MKLESPAPAGGEDGSSRSDLDRALKELLVGEARVRIDPATGEIVSADGEKSVLTDHQDPPTIR